MLPSTGYTLVMVTPGRAGENRAGGPVIPTLREVIWQLSVFDKIAHVLSLQGCHHLSLKNI